MQKGKVLLAMSGGTDSSVSAMRLQEEGYEVHGVTFHLSGQGNNEPEFILAARELAAQLGIPHHTLDIREQFEQEIITYFEKEYLEGRTPHPCVRCNNLIKWPVLIQMADKLGCEFVATGHYARVEHHDGKSYIVRGADPEKEQSFFLWGMPQSTLRRALFPLGGYHKTEVRKMAAERGFQQVASKKDSMGICFVPGDYRPFLKDRLAPKNQLPGKGNYIIPDGTIVGKHEGHVFYTIGQRRGLGIHLNRALYVTGINPATNDVILGSRDELLTDTIQLKNYNLVSPETIESERLIVRIRYRKQATWGRIILRNSHSLTVKLEEAIVREAEGQTATFYDGDRVVGGGWITH